MNESLDLIDKKKVKIVHPILIAIFPILILYSQNMGEMSVEDLILPILLVVGFSVCLYYCLNRVIKNNNKSAIIVSILLIILFSYGHIYYLLSDISPEEFDIARNRYLIPLFTAILIAGTIFTIKTKRILNNATSVINVISFVFIIVAISNVAIVTSEILNCNDCSNQEIFYEERDFSNYFEIHNFSVTENQKLPNIYYLILDEYAREDALLEYHEYDNSEFLGYLESKGFHVAKNSFSNYAMSVSSIPSIMNMEYMNFLSKEIGTEVRNFKPLIGKDGLYSNNQVIKNFKEMGYKIITFNTFSLESEPNSLSDITTCHQSLYVLENKLVDALSRTSIFGYFVERWSEAEIRQATLCGLDKFASIGNEIDEPIFVWSHVMLPHPPWVFGANGEEVTPGTPLLITDNPEFRESGWEPRTQYIQQLQFANKKTIEIIEEILEKDSYSIIIIQGDHGTAWELNWKDPSREDVLQRLRNLDAIYFPDEEKREVLDDDRTLVNTFRTIFNTYYGSNYEYLEDKMYWSFNAKPYYFTDVTKIIFEENSNSQ
jgi:hypothetical protein